MRARGQGGRVGEICTEGDAHFPVEAQVADHRRNVYGVQSEPGVHSPPSGRDICQRPVVWRGEYPVCERHPATPTCQRSPRVRAYLQYVYHLEAGLHDIGEHLAGQCGLR